jgi:RNA 2',3'-cyclic 3'-phosphodiesterase
VSATRSFVAIELSDPVRERLGRVRSEFASLAPEWRDEKWVAKNNLHVTLKFLGSLDDLQLAGVRSQVSAALSGVAPFALDVSGLRAVPGLRRCSMVWARFTDDDGRCADLASRVERAATAMGLPAEEHRFSPHVTLVRARRPHSLDAGALTSANVVACAPQISMSVLSATLFASTLTRTGPEYEAIDSWTLSGEE